MLLRDRIIFTMEDNDCAQRLLDRSWIFWQALIGRRLSENLIILSNCGTEIKRGISVLVHSLECDGKTGYSRVDLGLTNPYIIQCQLWSRSQ